VIGQFAYLPQGSTLAVVLDDERFKTGQLLSGWPGRCRPANCGNGSSRGRDGYAMV